MYARTMRKRGAVVAVEAHAEVLALPGGVVNRWTASFAGKARDFASQEAPSNKRPRWQHYGKPLKASINRSRVRFHKAPRGFRLYSAIGSTKHYSLFVDQGTEAFNAKILPPWERNTPSLYEHTWAPPGGKGKPLGTIRVRGQEGQFFLDKGIRRAFAYKRLRYTAGTRAQVAAALRSTAFPSPDFLGSTPWTFAFQTQLEQWRQWRDEAFYNHRQSFDIGSPHPSRNSAARIQAILARKQRANEARSRPRTLSPYRQRNVERTRKWREQKRRENEAKGTANTSKSQTEQNRKRALKARLDRAVQREQDNFLKANPGFVITRATASGFYYTNRRGDRKFRNWSPSTLELFRKYL